MLTSFLSFLNSKLSLHLVKTYSDDLSLPEDGLRLVIEEGKRGAKLDRDISFDQVVDYSLLREVAAAHPLSMRIHPIMVGTQY